MTTMTSPARGLRGDYHPENNPHDLTGNRHIANIAAKDELLAGQAHLIEATKTGPHTMLYEKGGAPYAVPTHVVELICAAHDRGVL